MVELSDFLQGAGTVVSAFNPAVGSAIGIIGGLISGSTPSVSGITAAQQGALSGGFGGPTTSTGTSVGPEVVFSGTPIEAGGGGLIVRGTQAVVRALPTIIAGGAGAVATDRMFLGPTPPPRTNGMPTRRQLILAQARAFSPGATAKKIVRSARQCGIELSAATLGLDVLSVCFLIAQPATRRARGISAADLRRTRSTLRKVANIQHDLGHLKSPIRRRRK